MAIRATCGNCGSTFNARDELAGKKVKCPKCKARMVIPAAKAAPVSAGVASATKAIDPMEALLKEANIGPVTSGGPICPDCATPIVPGAVICVDCGFNMETGKRLRTAKESEDGSVDSGLSAAEKLMRKAEAEIEDTPIGADDQDFGDGGDSFVIAGVAGIILAVLVGIGLLVIFSMDVISLYYNSGGISFIASCCMWIVAWIGNDETKCCDSGSCPSIFAREISRDRCLFRVDDWGIVCRLDSLRRRSTGHARCRLLGWPTRRVIGRRRVESSCGKRSTKVSRCARDRNHRDFDPDAADVLYKTSFLDRLIRDRECGCAFLDLSRHL